MKPLFARIHNVLAWVIFAGGALLIYLIALTVFGGGSASMHAMTGQILLLLGILLLVAALVSRSSRPTIILSLLVPVMLFVQGFFVHVEGLPPAVKALHGLNGLAVMAICFYLAKGHTRDTVTSDQSAVKAPMGN